MTLINTWHQFTFLSVFICVLTVEGKVLGTPPKQITDIRQSSDFIKNNVKVLGDSASYIDGQDHTLLDEKNQRLYVFSMDHTIYMIDLKSEKTYFIAKTPVMPGGAAFNPADNSKIIFCATKLQDHQYSYPAETGVYELDLSTNPAQVNLLLSEVFKDKYSGAGEGVVYNLSTAPTINTQVLAQPKYEPIRRKFGICDDVAISKDGQRIYIAEPYQTQGGGFGDEITGKVNQEEILMASQNGKLWMYDRQKSAISLIATNFAFVDGIALEKFDSNGIETSILFTELAKYRLHRVYLRESSPQSEVLFKDLPGMPNAITVDEQGRIFVAFNKMRTKILDLLYNNTFFRDFFKRLALSLPASIKPVPKESGFLVLKPDDNNGYDPIYYTVHDGSVLTSLIHLTPDIYGNRIYFSVFDTRYKGIFYVPMPEDLKLNQHLN